MTESEQIVVKLIDNNSISGKEAVILLKAIHGKGDNTIRIENPKKSICAETKPI